MKYNEIRQNVLLDRFTPPRFQGDVMNILMRAEDYDSRVATSPVAFIENLQPQ